MIRKQSLRYVSVILLALILIIPFLFSFTTHAQSADRADFAESMDACRKADIKTADGNYGPCSLGYQKNDCNSTKNPDYKSACERGIKLWDDTHPATPNPTPAPTPTPAAPVPPAAVLAQNPPPDPEEPTTCAVEKIGWIICPIFEGAARAADRAFVFLAEWFLEVPPELFNNDSKTKDAWEQARNLANVAFVIAFLILIYSQITGGVMSNYGIKRMLPRLIIAAIAVNISYYICQAMVDVSNLLGFNIKAALDSISDGLPKVFYQDPNQVGSTNTQTSSGGLSAITIGVLGAAGIAWALMGIMGGSLGVAIGTIIFILIILMLRKALIILLIVVSPLAFVAYLLPNTESYFKQWLNMFWQLLLVFPIVAMLLGAGQLAGGIVLNSGVTAAGQPTVNQNCTEGVDVVTREPCGSGTFETGAGQAPWGLGLAAAVITVGPMVLVFTVIKTAVAVGGAALSKMSAQIEGSSKSAGGGITNVGKLAGKGIGKAAMANGTVAAMKANWDARGHHKKFERAKKIVKANEAPNALQARLLEYSSGAIDSDKRHERHHANQANAIKMKKQLAAEETEAISMLGEAEMLRNPGTGMEDYYGKQLSAAISKQDDIAMKAFIDNLAALGKSGEDELERVLDKVSTTDANNGAYRSAMNHMMQKHGAMANTSNGLITYAYFAAAGQSKTMQQINSDPEMWTGMTVAQQANQRASVINKDENGRDFVGIAPALQSALSDQDQFIVDAAGNRRQVSRAEYAAHHNLIGRHDNHVSELATSLAGSHS